MYLEEFEKLWESQSKHDPNAFHDELKQDLWNALFFYRQPKAQRNLIENCDLEPTRKRIRKCSLAFQEFRIFDNLANFRVVDPIEGDSQSLTVEQKQLLFNELNRVEKLTWPKVRKILGIDKSELIQQQEGGAKNLTGNKTAHAMIKAIGEDRWDALSYDDKNRLVTETFDIESEESLRNRVINGWKFDEKTAEKLIEAKLEKSVGKYSHKAITALLPHLKNGKDLWQAQVECGYTESRGQDETPFVPHPDDIRNPVVMKVIHETRKVVNAVIREYGKPDVIRIEMARDLKASKDDKIAYNKAIAKNRNENEKVEETLLAEFKEFSKTAPSRDDIVKYRLWKECNEVCPYSGKKILPSQLFGNQVQVEHIIPYSKSYDNSYGNKTLGFIDWNNRKDNNTPYQAFGQSEDWNSMLDRVSSSKMSFGKQMRFKTKEQNFEKLSTRQLNDTRYACKAVAKLIGSLGVQVGVSQGKLTHAIRYQWRLNRLLSDDNYKNRDDHRHHAIDALITALVSPKLLQRVSHISQNLRGATLADRLFDLPMPWKGFVNDTESKVRCIVVSHAPHNKIAEGFHEETAYGKRKDGTLTLRKSLNPEDRTFISVAEIERIRDQDVAEIVKTRLAEHGFDPKSPDKAKLKTCMKEALSTPLLHKDGKTPIKRVRLELNKPDKSLLEIIVNGSPLKYHLLGNNHHSEIFKDKDGKWSGEVITNYRALTRVKEGKSPYKRTKDDHEFVMTLAKQEMIELIEDGKKEYYTVQKMRSDDGRVQFRKHSSALKTDTKQAFMTPISKLGKSNPRKVLVDPLGKIHAKND
jgi:CRISPR-associated endonuclease Csn1